ncbi:hypothetical protein LTR56_024587 [Elasticomyces elasticus]|nr:hypothetical protein LTR56_024587 [Elasticomyces elasticus]KAK4905474.1 hypothetical protein LTR49_025251 [Elasticomyces elasticus]KAK5746090.1 hypothetical protein LTS12_022857 [Elasticomyces elasticus]
MSSPTQASVDEGQQEQWGQVERMYSLDKYTFTKRELKPHEQSIRSKGERVGRPANSRSRLQNEFYILRYIRQHTDIPVPEPISCVEEDGITILKIARITDGSVLMEECVESDGAVVVEAVERQMANHIIPALQKHRSRRMGGLNTTEQLVLPWLVSINYEDDSTWSRIPETEGPDFVLCHNDLGQHNIFIDPKTYTIRYIIDWEYSGWYPAEWELPLWRYPPGQHNLNAHGRERAADVFDRLHESTAASDPTAPNRRGEEDEWMYGPFVGYGAGPDEGAEELANEAEEEPTPLVNASTVEAIEEVGTEKIGTGEREMVSGPPSQSAPASELPWDSSVVPQQLSHAEEGATTEAAGFKNPTKELTAVKQQLDLAEEVVDLLKQQLALAHSGVSLLKQQLLLIEQGGIEPQA